MIRIIIEGKKDKAEYTFWNRVLKYASRPYKIYCTNGNSNWSFHTLAVIQEACKGDLVILGLDQYTWDSYRNCERKLRRAATTQQFTLVKLGAKSFEGMFVSYTELLSTVNCKKQIIRDILMETADSLRAKRSISSKLYDFHKRLSAAKINPDIHNEERFISWLLNQVTLTPRARNISKDKIGHCWTVSCCNEHPNTKRVCPYKGLIHKALVDKLAELEYNSTLKYGTHTFRQILNA
jgi:hypothetical protein